MKSESELDENPFVQVNRIISEIEQMRATLLVGLSKTTPLDANLLSYFNEAFTKFSAKAQHYSAHLLKSNESNPQSGFEDLFGSLYTESEFADRYTNSYIAYTTGSLSWF